MAVVRVTHRDVVEVVVVVVEVVVRSRPVRMDLTGSANESLNVTAAATKRTYVYDHLLEKSNVKVYYSAL